MSLARRRFLEIGLAGIGAQAANLKPCRAAIIGDTAHGGYGHGWDSCFVRFPSVKVVAVADPVDSGRSAAIKRSSAERGYRDYREMLRAEKPDLVAVLPLNQRLEMVLAAIEVGAHVLTEKPLARNLQEADRIVGAAERAGVRIQVGYPTRPAPVTSRIRDMVRAGEIGTLLEIRARGKEDSRAGGADLIVLGTITFDLMRYFAGDPAWVFGHVIQDGRELGSAELRTATTPIGTVAGNDIAAVFAFQGLHGYFSSKANDRPNSRFGLTLCGSRGLIDIPLSSYPSAKARVLKSASWFPNPPDEAWQSIELPPGQELRDRDDVNAAVVADLLDAIQTNRAPACSARDGRWALEMALGIYQSQESGARVPLPLRDRRW